MTSFTIVFTLWNNATNKPVQVELTKQAESSADALTACMRDIEANELSSGHAYMYLAEGRLAAVLID